jgi:energy-coupling factor transporter ATP-binding protein EcfA2
MEAGRMTDDFSPERLESEILRIEDERARRRQTEQQTAQQPTRPVYWRAPQLVAEIMARVHDPWLGLRLGGDEIVRVRAGATVVIIGGAGSGKSSLTACMLVEHARDIGPAIALSIELPGDEFGARIVGIRCDASWEDSLRGKVALADMERALGLDRLFVLDRRRATLANLERAIDDARAEYPGQPILVAIDYAQLLDSKEREARQRVADVFTRIDEMAREKRVVALALSQMSRVSAQKARKGEALGAESADLGAETAAIERFATCTLTIGLASTREDGSETVELSVGKWRMGKGDTVHPMIYRGRTGLWRCAGEAKSAAEVRESRESDRESKDRSTIELAMIGFARQAPSPISRQQLIDGVGGKIRKATKTAAITALLVRGDLVEVNRRPPRSKYWLVWTRDRARDAGIMIRENEDKT